METGFDRDDPHLLRSPAFVAKVDEIWDLVRAEAQEATRHR